MTNSPSATIIDATVDALRVHMPFDQMDSAHLRKLAGQLTLRYYAKGAEILSPLAGNVNKLWIVQRGLVKGASRAATTDTSMTLHEGEMFPIGAILSARPTVLTFIADTDVFCYEMAMPVFEETMDHSRPFRHFATRRLGHLLDASRRLTQSEFSSQTTSAQTLASPLKSLIRRAPVTVKPGTPIHDVLKLMKQERIGSVIVVADDDSKEPVGIFTERDVLDRVALPQIDQRLAIRSVMTMNPFSIAAHAPLFDAAKAMAQRRFRHVLIVDEGRLIGVISERDLFTQQRLSLGQIAKAIERAETVAALAAAAMDVRQLARTLIGQGVAAEQLTQFVTTMNDAIVTRALALASLEIEPPSTVTWCWIGLGSEGRMEQTLATDQDNALIFSLNGGNDHDIATTREQLLAFASATNLILDQVGFPLCRGDIMAKNPKWCLTQSEWRETFSDWLHAANPQALLNAAIFFDFRPLAGDVLLAEDLKKWLLDTISDHPLFLRHMATNAMQVTPPLGMLRDFADTDSEYPGTIDLKKYAARPFIDAVRIFALANNVAATNTAERLRASCKQMRVAEDEVNAYVDAFHFVQLLRLRIQPNPIADQAEALAGTKDHANPNRVDIDELNELDRRILKEALRQARKLQSRLEMDYQL